MGAEGYRYINSLFQIVIFIRDDEDYKKLVKVNVDIDGDVFDFHEPEFIEFDPYSSYKKPFEIHIDAYGYYNSYEGEEEEEEEEEGEEEEEENEQPITVIKSFREDKCIVCLSKEPKVLFYDCMHYCVCLECVERKPFKSCPYCGTRILTKII